MQNINSKENISDSKDFAIFMKKITIKKKEQYEKRNQDHFNRL
jgi:hypothetical protein